MNRLVRIALAPLVIFDLFFVGALLVRWVGLRRARARRLAATTTTQTEDQQGGRP